MRLLMRLLMRLRLRMRLLMRLRGGMAPTDVRYCVSCCQLDGQDLLHQGIVLCPGPSECPLRVRSQLLDRGMVI
jgi:hypothetical protein